MSTLSSYTTWAVEYLDATTGEACRVPCLDERDARKTAAEMFDTHYSVCVVSTVRPVKQPQPQPEN